MKITYRNKTWEMPGGMAARDAILKVGLNPESELVVRNGQLVTDDTILRDEDEVKLVAVVSGGTTNDQRSTTNDRGTVRRSSVVGSRRSEN